MMLTVVIIYAICWLPLNMINIAGDINPKIYNITGMNYIWMSFHWLAMSNCMYNPFIYCWMNAKFRNGFRKVLNHFTCGLIKEGNDIEMTRFRRNDTVTTSVGRNGSLLRYPSKSRSDSYNDYSSMIDKSTKGNNLEFDSDDLKT
ncbi:hypothetical protein FSP39_017354 [Pinctada imbricata]|uniref:G-protein coupled receptors family 1 profile domain-containing protein n=1 Tax=Pinctada imbricata TaxID=66713 RepID=A0AA88XVI3_PINIB|nr:hypothetical protein FSP39_017354 [Pinctada imbricata]